MQKILNHKGHKAIIFDMDGTFYPNSVCEKQYHDFAILAVMHYMDCSRSEAVGVLTDARIATFTQSENPNSLTDLIVNHGITMQDWNSFREEHYILDFFSGCESVNPRTLVSLKRSYRLFLVSNNTLKSIQHILHALNVPLETFDEIYPSTSMMRGGKKMMKDYVYEQICRKYKLSPQQVIVVGDRFAVDVLPMLDLGGDGFVIERPSDIDLIAGELEDRPS
jgi:FMN phosphatase YigB (HAD superfamily)